MIIGGGGFGGMGGGSIAGLFGFARKPYFEAAEGTDAAPEVQF